jgi:hypothetical protein
MKDHRVSDLVNLSMHARVAITGPWRGAAQEVVQEGQGKIVQAYDKVDQLMRLIGEPLESQSFIAPATVTRLVPRR